MNKNSVTEAIQWRSFIKSWPKFSSPTEQRLFVTKQRRWKKFYRLLPIITRLHQILKWFSWNTGTSFNSNLDLHISLNSHRLYLTRRKNHSRIFYFAQNFLQSQRNHKTLKKKKPFQEVCFQTSWNFTNHDPLLATRSACMPSRVSYHNPTEQTKLAPDHLLTTPSFSLWTFQFIIYSERRSWGLVDFN